MRISTQMMYEQNMRGVTNAQSKWLAYGEQMSTGQRVNRPSDDPIAASQAVVISQAQSQNTQYATARTFAEQKVSLEESVLQQVTTAIQARSLLSLRPVVARSATTTAHRWPANCKAIAISC